jgi:uncharacterized Ntn-hydrolase superfamily protein
MSFTVLIRSTALGLIGGAVASRSLAVGNSVMALDPATGIVASQAWTNRALRARMLDALADGQDADAVVARLPEWDDRSDLRQVAVLPRRGPGAARTGAATTPWAGHRVGADHVVIGNLLAGPEVVDAISAVASSPPRPSSDVGGDAITIAELLVSALRAGDAHGGDRRGRQSSAIQVARVSEQRTWPPELVIDLRVDDHVDPLAELARLVALRADDLRDGAADGVSARTG